MINASLAALATLSLVVAALMTAVAWTAKRDQHRRAAARIAVLARAIHAGDPWEQPAGRPSRFTFTRFASIGVAVVATLAVCGLAFVSTSGAGKIRSSRQVERIADAPLDLVALEHDRDDNRLLVRGIVRNPGSAATVSNLAAVVLFYAKDGSFISSRRAAVAARALAPGADTAFVVALPDADSVDRYRVSFRTEDRIVPHIDRRARSALARRE